MGCAHVWHRGCSWESPRLRFAKGKMNVMVSFTLILALVMSPRPVTAQERTEATKSFNLGDPAPMTGPLARAAIREAVRLAATPDELTTSADESVEQRNQSGQSDWSRVRDLGPGTEIVVIVIGQPPATRYLITQDESRLTVLNVSVATLPVSARNELRGVASHHAEYFAAAQQGRTFVLGKSVRLEPHGVFVADRRAADLTQIIEHVGRHDVVEIDTTERHRNWLVCGVVGYGGFFAAGMAAGFAGGYISDSLGGAMLGALIGGSAGGVWAYRKCRHKPEEVIYRAP
jgi:hypothetical protein